MLGLLLYLSSTVIGNSILFLAFIICCFRLERADFRNDFFLLCLIVSFSIVNFLLSLLGDNIYHESSKSILVVFPYAIFFIGSYVISKTVNPDELKILLYLICFEIFIGVIEYGLGIPSILGIKNAAEFGEVDGLLYNRRVLGLSTNSSSLALKCLCGLMLVQLLSVKRKVFFVSILLIGFFITFNRTYLFSAFPLLIWILYVDILKRRFGLLLFLLSIFVIIFISILPFFIEQFLRGATLENISYVTSGRDIVYEEFWNFFLNHFWQGNGSVKLWLVLREGDIYHAHNSFLMTLASNGILISLLYFYMFFKNINRSNWIYCICLFLASIAQYTIWWGLAFSDIIYFLVIFNSLSKYNSNKLIDS